MEKPQWLTGAFCFFHYIYYSRLEVTIGHLYVTERKVVARFMA